MVEKENYRIESFAHYNNCQFSFFFIHFTSSYSFDMICCVCLQQNSEKSLLRNLRKIWIGWTIYGHENQDEQMIFHVILVFCDNFCIIIVFGFSHSDANVPQKTRFYHLHGFCIVKCPRLSFHLFSSGNLSF